MRNVRTGPKRPVRILSVFGPAAAAFALAAAGPIAPAAAAAPQVQLTAAAAAGQGLKDFYKARDDQLLWLSKPGRQAHLLIDLLASADLDGVAPGRYRVDNLRNALQAASSGNRRAMRRADAALSQAFVDYVRDRFLADVHVLHPAAFL